MKVLPIRNTMDCAMSSGLPTRPASKLAERRLLLLRRHPVPPGRVDDTRRHRVHPAGPQLDRERLDQALDGRVDGGKTCSAGVGCSRRYGRDEGDRAGRTEPGERLLRQRKMRPELRLESGSQIGRCDLGEGSRASSSAERHHEVVEPADLGQGTLSVFRICGVERADGGLCAELLLHRFELGAIPAIDHRRRAAFDQEPGRGQVDSG